MLRRCCLLPVVLALLAAPSLLAAGEVNSPPPVLRLISKVDREKRMVIVRTTVTQMVPYTATKIIDGKQITYTTYKQMNHGVDVMMVLQGAKFYDGRGNTLSEEAGWRRLQPKAAVIFADTAKIPAPYLELLREDVLIVVPDPNLVKGDPRLPRDDPVLPKDPPKQ